MTLRIEAPHFVAGAVFDTHRRVCSEAAPIIRYMIGWSPERTITYVKRKNWRFQWISPRTACSS